MNNQGAAAGAGGGAGGNAAGAGAGAGGNAAGAAAGAGGGAAGPPLGPNPAPGPPLGPQPAGGGGGGQNNFAAFNAMVAAQPVPNLQPPPPLQQAHHFINWFAGAGAGGQFPHQMNAGAAQAAFGGVAQQLNFGNMNQNNENLENPLAGGPYAAAFVANPEVRVLPDDAENAIVMEDIPDGTLMVDLLYNDICKLI